MATTALSLHMARLALERPLLLQVVLIDTLTEELFQEQ
jgi:hypothetical protein